jgi:hypothetical protein
MHRNLLKVSFFICLTALKLFASEPGIKSLRVYSSGDETSFPVVENSGGTVSSITIDFDLDCESYPNLVILFKFCDSDWNPYENAFLSNPLYNKQPNLFLDKLPLTVKGARYHYSGLFPNNRVEFPFSGKWMLFITDSQNPNLVLGSGKFFVVNTKMKLNVQVAKESLQGDFGDKANLGRTLSIKTSFALFDSLFAVNVTRIEIIKNRMMNYPIIVDRVTNSQDRYYEWDAAQRFSFIARLLRPGNNYRQTDTRNTAKYNTTNVEAKFGEIETSDLFTRRGNDNNGGTLLMNWRNEYADYHNVVFKFRAPENIKQPIFLVGSFSDWKVLPENEMYDDKGMMNLSIPLKRGVYDYQYVVGNVAGNQIQDIDWEILEGNFFETDNEYHIFVFYQTTDKGGYDQIIGYEKIRTGAL